MGFGVLDIRCGARWGQSRVFCVRELRDARLWRRASGRRLAAAWPSNRDERDVAVWRSTAVIFEVLRRTLVRTLDING